MLRNENIPVVHAYDDADVALTMALPWVRELGWPSTDVRLAAALELLSLRGLRFVINSLEVAFLFSFVLFTLLFGVRTRRKAMGDR